MNQMEEDSIRDIMEQLSLSREEAIAWRQKAVERIHQRRLVIYNFVKEHNPRVAEMEKDERYRKRFASVAEAMQVSSEVAQAHVITGDLLAEGGMKIFKKRKRKSDPSDFQEMLGVTVPVPQEVMDALGAENA